MYGLYSEHNMNNLKDDSMLQFDVVLAISNAYCIREYFASSMIA